MYPGDGDELGEAMRFRGTSIRRKIVALLLVPLVSLAGIWGFATVLTGRAVTQLYQVTTVIEDLGYPIEDAIRVLQQERRQTLVHLADPRAAESVAALRRARDVTDRAVARIEKAANDPDVRDGLDQSDEERLTAVLDAFKGIKPLRSSVDEGDVNRAQALERFNGVVEPCYTLLAALDSVDDVDLDKQARALVNLSRGRELLAREDALLGSALVRGRLTRQEIELVGDLVAQRTLLYEINLPTLPAPERERYEAFWKSTSTALLRQAENIVASSNPGPSRFVTARSWDENAAVVLKGLAELDDQAGERYQERVKPVAVGVIVKAAVAGVLGLLAVILSVVLSVRVGRGLIRDLRRLRLEALEASGVRLPSVMRRLSAGEHVDVEAEVPRQQYAKNEIGEVGQALNTLQRAAVEAAVKQAELRAGVSEVFVNLARRSQVLLHKQLTLLDTMERRTEDTDELADLFRLDHLTTRMRRHAEGLVILSGAAPSRQWRRPVQLMDVVRAAVAEVEDYERIEVRRLPRVAVKGPAVADLTHLVAELLENATVFSPPHTAVQVVGSRVPNGFTLEIHDRGLGMSADALLDANLRLAETPEFELSDTDRLGLFVVSRLAQRQNVRVSLQPSPYGGTTAVVFIPNSLLSEDVPDTNGIGFRLDRARPSKEAERERARRGRASSAAGDAPAEPAAVDLDAVDDRPGDPDDEDDERGALFRPRRPQPSGDGADGDPSRTGDPHAPVPLTRRTTPKLVSSHGRPVGARRGGAGGDEDAGRAHPQPSPLPLRRAGAAGRDAEAPEIPGADAHDSDEAHDTHDAATPSGLPRRTRRGADIAASVARKSSEARSRAKERREEAEEPLPENAKSPESPESPEDVREAREELPQAREDAHGDAPRAREDATPDARRADDAGEAHARVPAAGDAPEHTNPATGEAGSGEPAPGSAPAARPHDGSRPGAARPERPGAADRAPASGAPAGTSPLPRRIRQTHLAPQLRESPAARRREPATVEDRDAELVRSRMTALQRGWQRGRAENAESGETGERVAHPGSTRSPGTGTTPENTESTGVTGASGTAVPAEPAVHAGNAATAENTENDAAGEDTRGGTAPRGTKGDGR